MWKKFTLGFLFIVGALIAVYWGVSSKAYPIATVNNNFISMRQFHLAAIAAQTYYERVGSVYGGFASTTQVEFEDLMRQATLQSLIEDRLIQAELETLFEIKPLDMELRRRVNEALTSSTQVTSEVTHELFGLNLEEFNDVVLLPRARIELLQSELMRSGSDISVWLPAALQDASVNISLTDLAWANDHVELTGATPYTAKVKELFEQVVSSTASLVASSTSSSSPEGE